MPKYSVFVQEVHTIKIDIDDAKNPQHARQLANTIIEFGEDLPPAEYSYTREPGDWTVLPC